MPRETSTIKRIRALIEGGFIHPDDGECFEAAYQTLLHHTLTAQVENVFMKKFPEYDAYGIAAAEDRGF